MAAREQMRKQELADKLVEQSLIKQQCEADDVRASNENGVRQRKRNDLRDQNLEEQNTMATLRKQQEVA